MNKKSINLLLVAILLVLALSACNRALSTAPAPAPQQTLEGFKVQEQPADAISQSATQTAIASAGGGKAEVTPKAVEQPDTVEVTPAPTEEPKEEKPVVLPTEGRPSTYVLQKGEWPICIARRFNLDIGTFFQANGLNMNSKPAAGTTLKIPQSGSWSDSYGSRALKAHGSSHVVQAGETVYSIACSYGDVNPDAIIAANHLESPYTLSAGQTLTIP